jgi:glycosyltransferase involved in cell wall biosynthesis
MKVLLLHEFSGVHNELQAGLRAIGIDATTANFGDDFRRFPSDIYIGNTDRSHWGSVRRAAHQVGLVGVLRGYDVIQSITASVFNPLASWFLEAAVLKNKAQSYIYLAASGDAVYRKHVRSFQYSPVLDWYERPAQLRREMRVLGCARRIVAGAWDYLEVYRREGYASKFIPFPVMTSKVQFHEIAQRPRLRVLHPLNRVAGDDYKGTSHILAAFRRLESKFGRDVEFLAVGGLPFSEYMALADSCDVIVDQAYTMSYGMSAIYAMAQGKVVLSGKETATEELGCYADSPVINIQPSVDQIVARLEELLDQRSRLRELGFRSRQFAERYHDAIVVAEQYADVYRAAANGDRRDK